MKHNKKRFRKAKGTKAHECKMCSSMKEDELTDNVLNGDLNIDGCDDEDVN